jgi:hypothetical protein
VSAKALCPACQAYTSNVRFAFEGGDGCPYCGLSADAAAQVMSARERGATAEMVEVAAKAEARAEKAEAQAAKLRYALAEIAGTVQSLLADA